MLFHFRGGEKLKLHFSPSLYNSARLYRFFLKKKNLETKLHFSPSLEGFRSFYPLQPKLQNSMHRTRNIS